MLAAWTLTFPADGYAVSCLSHSGGSVSAAKGLVISAHHSFADSPSYDVLLHPGGQGTRPLMRDEEHLGWVRKQRAEVPLMTSVCTGSLVSRPPACSTVARRRRTGVARAASRTDPRIEVRADERFVDDGDIVTSAGVSAGIDMALHLAWVGLRQRGPRPRSASIHPVRVPHLPATEVYVRAVGLRAARGRHGITVVLPLLVEDHVQARENRPGVIRVARSIRRDADSFELL